VRAEVRKGNAKAQERLDSEPTLHDDLVPTWNAFMALDRARSVGFVPNPISMEAVAVYFDIYGIEGDERRVWLERIQAMDAALMKHYAEREEK
jgi:hypothetical protein